MRNDKLQTIVAKFMAGVTVIFRGGSESSEMCVWGDDDVQAIVSLSPTNFFESELRYFRISPKATFKFVTV